MTAASIAGMRPRRVAMLAALCTLLPILSVTYQIAAKSLALDLGAQPFGVAWIVAAISSPWCALLVSVELASFALWMGALSELKLSAAFLLTAFSYVLIIAAGVIAFHEPIDALQLVGGTAILAGIGLVATGEIGNPEHDGGAAR